MPRKPSYREWLKQDLDGLIDALDLPDLQKHFLRSRWLDQVIWIESTADRNRVGYYGFRLTAIIGGVIVPALVSLNVSSELGSAVVHWATVGLSLLVAISVAVEEFFHFGERWRHYRRAAELLKSEGWQFFQKSGRYQAYERHEQAYPLFAAQVEVIAQQEVEVYITDVVREKQPQSEIGGPGNKVQSAG